MGALGRPCGALGEGPKFLQLYSPEELRDERVCFGGRPGRSMKAPGGDISSHAANPHVVLQKPRNGPIPDLNFAHPSFAKHIFIYSAKVMRVEKKSCCTHLPVGVVAPNKLPFTTDHAPRTPHPRQRDQAERPGRGTRQTEEPSTPGAESAVADIK